MKRSSYGATAMTLVLLAGCGPSKDVDLTVKQQPVDVVYGEPERPADVATRPADSALVPSTFPGFLAPPVRLDAPSEGPRLSPPPPTVACPAADPLAAPARAAGASVSEPPKPGVYHYRRSGALRTSKVDHASAESAPPQPLDPVVRREVRDVLVTDIPTSEQHQIEYSVVQEESGLRTTSTFVVRPDDGVYIKQIVTERADLPGRPGEPGGVESFSPQPFVKIVSLPLAIDPGEPYEGTPQQTGKGVDPLTGISMETYFQNVGRTSVDACGTLIQAWKIKVPRGSFTRANVRQFNITATFAFAPQLGGLILSEDVVLHQGLDQPRGHFFRQDSITTINSADPT